jgi:phenylalanyl-tRNA synthetase alpha chain
MERLAPAVPVRVVHTGKTYRRDEDATHSPMFHQMEGLVIDRGIRMSDLKGTLEALVHGLFGKDRKILLRPSFFPFTEPSAEVDVSCLVCGGDGHIDGHTCPVCKGTGWLEILGAGMVNPKVLAKSGYDPEIVSGFAFGMGLERVAMLKYGLDNIRDLYTNDMRVLSQF